MEDGSLATARELVATEEALAISEESIPSFRAEGENAKCKTGNEKTQNEAPTGPVARGEWQELHSSFCGAAQKTRGFPRGAMGFCN